MAPTKDHDGWLFGTGLNRTLILVIGSFVGTSTKLKGSEIWLVPHPLYMDQKGGPEIVLQIRWTSLTTNLL